MDSSSLERDPVDQLAEEFAARCRAGETPSITEYAQRHPELADQIRDLFPALLAMERLKPTADLTAPFGEDPTLVPGHQRRVLAERSGEVGGRLEALHRQQSGEEVADLVSQLRMSLRVLGNRRGLAGAAARSELLGQLIDRIALETGRVHATSS